MVFGRFVRVLRNPTDHELEIASFASSCRCTTIKPNSLKLLPHETADVTISFDLCFNIAGEEEVVPGGVRRPARKDFSEDVVATVTRPVREEKTWTFRGRVKKALFLTPAHLEIERSLIEAKPFPPQKVLVRSSMGLETVKASCDRAMAGVAIDRLDPCHYELKVEPSPLLPVGRFEYRVYLTASTLEGESLPTVYLPVAGHVLSRFEVLPSPLVCGLRFVGETISETVMIRDRHGQKIELISSIGDDLGASIQLLPDSDQDRRSVQVKLVVSQPGQQVVGVRLKVRTKESEVPLVVPISYYGVIKPEALGTGGK